MAPLRGMRVPPPAGLWVPIIRSWALTRGFALHPGTRNRYEIRYTRTQHRSASRHVNDHGRVSGTHTLNWPWQNTFTTALQHIRNLPQLI